MLACVNYEDRTDLLAPEQVVSYAVLAKLRELSPERAAQLMAAACDLASVAISEAAQDAMVVTVEEDTAPARGAPSNAGMVEMDAMQSGYRFGALTFGLKTDSGRSVRDLRERADAMYVYDLVIADEQGEPGDAIASVLDRHGAETDYALEEAAGWAWYFGLAVAVVEADLSPSG
jgi:hypothetical protein